MAGPVSFFNRKLLEDRNFTIGIGLYFMVGLLLYATRALLPPIHSEAGIAALNAEVTRQASFVASLNDFRLMMIATLVALPFLLLMRRRQPG